MAEVTRRGISAHVPEHVARGSVVRLGGTCAAAAFAAVTGVATARALGPADKGSLASISFIVALAATVASMGVGDALVVRARASVVTIRASTPGVLLTGVVAAVPCGLAAALVAAVVVDDLSFATATVAAAGVVPFAVVQVARRVSDGTARHGVTAATQLTVGAVTAAGTVVAVNVLGGGLAAALAVAGAGAAAGFVVHVVGTGRLPVDRAEPVTVPVAAGLPFMFALVARAAASRLDLLVVYLVAGPSAAGIYSIALTVGDVALYPAFSLAASVFGPTVRLDDDRDAVGARIARLGRASLVLGALVTVAAALVLPGAVPAAFGGDFRSAVAPALVLVLAAAPASAHWVITRAAAARDAASLATTSLLVGAGVMIALDLVQGSSLTPLRAAIACAIGNAVGLVVAVRGVRRHVAPIEWRSLLPRPADLTEMVAAVRSLRPTAA